MKNIDDALVNENNTRIKVSVIMPLYNDEIYLERTLQSVVSQSLKEIEIIIVDDCSTDNSVGIVEKFMKRDARIKLIRHDSNRGGGAARNTGMPYAKGEYLSFLDSDDYFYPNMLEEAYRRSKDVEADICVFNVKYAEGHTPAMNFNKGYIPKKDVFSVKDIPTKVFEVFNAIPWNKLFRRKFVESTGIRWSETFCSNDVYFVNTHLVLAERITALDRVLVTYENHAVENSQSKYNWYFRDAMGTYIELRKTLIERGKFDGKIKQSFVSRVNSALNWQFESIDIREKKEEYFSWLQHEGFAKLGLTEAKYEDYLIGNTHAYNQYCRIQRMMTYKEDEYTKYEYSLINEPINYNFMPVVYAVNVGYAMPLSVSISSLLENALPDTFYEISVLVSSAFEEVVKKDICSSMEKYSRYRLAFLTIDESLFDNVRIYTKHLDIETFFRLVTPNLFAYKDKIMYIDADTIICEDLSELLKRNMQSYYVMGIKAAAFMANDAFERRKRNELKVPSMKQYINAGVIMMNLFKMRLDNMQIRFMELMKNNYHQEDQDVINKACYGNIRHLPLKYNVMIKYLDNNSPDKFKGERVYAKDELENAFNAPVIIHFANKEKPWSAFDSFWAEKWFSYAEKSSMFCPKYYPLYEAYQAFKHIKHFQSNIETPHRHHSLPIGKGEKIETCKLTVIMPVYNMEKKLRDSLTSLIINLQQLGDAEAVIVDDCSSDSSLDILVAYAKEYPFLRVYSQEENMGVGAALNLGLSVARGEYVAFMEADERYFDYDSLKLLYETAKEQEVDICAGSLMECRANGRNLFDYQLSEECLFREDGYVNFYDWQQDNGYQRFIFKRIFLETRGIRFLNLRKYHQAHFLVKALLEAGKFYTFEKPVYVLRKHELKMSEKDMADLLRGINAVLSLAKEKGFDDLYCSTCRRYQELSVYFPDILKEADNPSALLKFHMSFLKKIDGEILERLGLDKGAYSLQAISNLYYPHLDVITQ